MSHLTEREQRLLTLMAQMSEDDQQLALAAVERYVDPQEFQDWAAEGEAMGFAYVASGPLVRSSYHAHEQADAYDAHTRR